MSFKSALEFTITKYCAEPARRGITVEVQRDPRPGLVHLVLTSAGGEEHSTMGARVALSVQQSLDLFLSIKLTTIV